MSSTSIIAKFSKSLNSILVQFVIFEISFFCVFFALLALNHINPIEF